MAPLLAGVDLAPAVHTAPAGAVKQVFGTAGLGTSVAIFGQGAVAAVLAGEEDEFREVLQPEKGAAQDGFV